MEKFCPLSSYELYIALKESNDRHEKDLEKRMKRSRVENFVATIILGVCLCGLVATLAVYASMIV